MIRNTFFALVLMSLVLMLAQHEAEARRHRKFKGVIIVNQILKLKGTIKDNGVDVPEYSGVKQGDLLETGDKSEAIIRVPGLAIFRLGPNTKFKLEKFNDRNDSRFELVSGNVLFLFRRAGDHFVKTPHGILTLHNNATFFVSADPAEKEDEACLCDGKLQVKADLPEPKKTETAADEPKKSKKKKKGEPSPSPALVEAVSPAPSASPSLLPSPSPGGILAAASPVTSPSIAAVPSPVVVASPEPSPSPVAGELQLVSIHEHKQFELSDKGVETGKNKTLDLHSDAEIKDLESIYALP